MNTFPSRHTPYKRVGNDGQPARKRQKPVWRWGFQPRQSRILSASATSSATSSGCPHVSRRSARLRPSQPPACRQLRRRDRTGLPGQLPAFPGTARTPSRHPAGAAYERPAGRMVRPTPRRLSRPHRPTRRRAADRDRGWCVLRAGARDAAGAGPHRPDPDVDGVARAPVPDEGHRHVGGRAGLGSRHDPRPRRRRH